MYSVLKPVNNLALTSKCELLGRLYCTMQPTNCSLYSLFCVHFFLPLKHCGGGFESSLGQNVFVRLVVCVVVRRLLLVAADLPSGEFCPVG